MARIALTSIKRCGAGVCAALASRRSLGRAFLSLGAVAILMIGLGGCQVRQPSRPHHSPSAAAVPVGDGIVVGGINACGGVLTSKSGHGFVSGKVIVLRGTITSTQEAGGVTHSTLPTAKFTSQRVSKHEEYRLALPPGPYVFVVAPYTQGASLYQGSVLVRAGKVVRKNLDCLALGLALA
jgi:hypothetical protein